MFASSLVLNPSGNDFALLRLLQTDMATQPTPFSIFRDKREKSKLCDNNDTYDNNLAYIFQVCRS